MSKFVIIILSVQWFRTIKMVELLHSFAARTVVPEALNAIISLFLLLKLSLYTWRVDVGGELI